jgi:hypothetical protein
VSKSQTYRRGTHSTSSGDPVLDGGHPISCHSANLPETLERAQEDLRPPRQAVVAVGGTGDPQANCCGYRGGRALSSFG